MSLLESNSLKKSLLIIVLLVIAQLDVASALAWPLPLLSFLRLTPVLDDTARGICMGLGVSLDVVAAFIFLRTLAKRALAAGRE